jgi:hypothetical protein
MSMHQQSARQAFVPLVLTTKADPAEKGLKPRIFSYCVIGRVDVQDYQVRIVLLVRTIKPLKRRIDIA